MTTVIAGMTTSLDGFVADSDGDAGSLYPDLVDLRDTAFMRSAIDRTGAVVMGRRTFEMGDPDGYVGTYEFQVPMFVVTHHPPAIAPKQDARLTFTFVTDGPSVAIASAKTAAADRDVTVVGGVDLISQLLRLGEVDELQVDVMPVVLGAGTRFLNDPALAAVTLEKIDVREVGARTSLRFRVGAAHRTR